MNNETKTNNKSKKIVFISSISIIVIIGFITIGVLAYRKQNKKQYQTQSYDDHLIYDSIKTEDEHFKDIPAKELQIVANRRNESNSFYEEKEDNGLIYKNILFIQSEDIVVFEADVLNQTGKDIPDTERDIVLLDKDANEICTFGIYIDAVENGKTRRIHAQIEQGFLTDADILIANNFTIK